LLFITSVIKVRSNPLTPSKSFIIGIAQAVAILPGLSRSGATISTGLFLGVKREEIARFSFLMVLVPVLGESFLDIIKGDFFAGNSTESISLIVGFLAAFLSGLIACSAMIKIVQKVKLRGFAYYCAILGILCITYILL
jgi:undecaprenyl-diphosphatase